VLDCMADRGSGAGRRAGQDLPRSSADALLYPVNWHQVIEERNHEMDEAVASVLRQDPSKLDKVVAWIERRLADPDYSIHAKDSLKEWLDLIQHGGLPSVLEMLRDRSEKALRLRQSSPFAVTMPQDQRLRILSRHETLRPRARPAGVSRDHWRKRIHRHRKPVHPGQLSRRSERAAAVPDWLAYPCVPLRRAPASAFAT